MNTSPSNSDPVPPPSLEATSHAVRSTGSESGGQEVNRQVVRLATSQWMGRDGFHVRKSLLFQRRKSSGYPWVENDVSEIGADLVLSKILNLNTVDDGIYEIIPCNESKDWETGTVDDYDYMLRPL